MHMDIIGGVYGHTQYIYSKYTFNRILAVKQANKPACNSVI